MWSLGILISTIAMVAHSLVHHDNAVGSRSKARLHMAKKGKLRELRSAGASGRSTKKKNATDLMPVFGITPPVTGKLKGWEIGSENSVRLVAARTDTDKLYVLESACSRCAWELEKGELIDESIACALCGQTYALSSGDPGAVVERDGLNKWLGNLARNAPTTRPAVTLRTVRAVLDGDTVLLDIAGSFLAQEIELGSSLQS